METLICKIDDPSFLPISPTSAWPTATRAARWWRPRSTASDPSRSTLYQRRTQATLFSLLGFISVIHFCNFSLFPFGCLIFISNSSLVGDFSSSELQIVCSFSSVEVYSPMWMRIVSIYATVCHFNLLSLLVQSLSIVFCVKIWVLHNLWLKLVVRWWCLFAVSRL